MPKFLCFYVMNVAFLSDLWYNIYVRKDSVETSKIMYIAPKTCKVRVKCCFVQCSSGNALLCIVQCGFEMYG